MDFIKLSAKYEEHFGVPIRWSVFILYSVIVCVTALLHESWADEAQSWLIARDLSWLELFQGITRYEGTPPLWHLISKIAITFGLPYHFYPMLSVMIAIIGVALWLFVVRAPLILVIWLPFSYFFLYQYSIVARSYCLLLPASALLAKGWIRFRDQPALLYVGAVIAGSSSVYGYLLAGSILLAALWKLPRVRTIILLHAKWLIFWIIYSIGIAFLIWPNPDCYFAQSNETFKLFTALKFIDRSLSNKLIYTAIAILISGVWMLTKKSGMTFFAGFFLMTIFAGIFYANVWHGGALFLLWVIALTIAFSAPRKAPAVLEQIFIISLLLIGFLQIIISAKSVIYDWNHDFSGASGAAVALRADVENNSRIYCSGFNCTAIQPYFSKSIFSNFDPQHNHAFWKWSKAENPQYYFDKWVTMQPDVVVLSLGGGRIISMPEWVKKAEQDLFASGYELTSTHYGTMTYQGELFEEESFLIFHRKIQS